MGPISQADRTLTDATLEGQVREMYGRVAYSHKTHEKMADAYESRFKSIKTAEIWVSALSTGSLVFAVLGDSRGGTIVGAIMSTFLLGLVLYFKEAPLGALAQKHSETATKLWGVREKLLSLLVDMKTGTAAAEVQGRRDSINKELERIYREAPRTNSVAYAAAQHALKTAEELYFSEEELDHLLPKQLRNGTGPGARPGN